MPIVNADTGASWCDTCHGRTRLSCPDCDHRVVPLDRALLEARLADIDRECGTAALVTAAIAALHAGRCVVPRVAEWDGEPDVWLHPNLDHLRPALDRAIAAWWDLGHDLALNGVLTGPPLGPEFGGHIAILPRPLDRVRAGTLASAVVTAEFDDEEFAASLTEDDHEIDAPEGIIRRAVIYVEPDADARILAHELGHALGYLHCTARLRRADASRGLQIPKAGHLMHPRYADGGWGTAGLEAEALGDPRERQRARREARR